MPFLGLFLHTLAAPFKSQARLEAEIVFLRHQLNVLRRRIPANPRLTVADRLLLVWLYRLVPSLLNVAVIVQPETIVRWHRSGFRLYWRWKSRSRGGRPKVAREIRRLIREMSLANPLRSQRSPNTWRGGEVGRRRPGRPFSVTTLRVSPPWTSWSCRPSASSCSSSW